MTRLISALLVFLFCSTPSVHGDTLDAGDKTHLADRVKTEFVHSWTGYKTYAWGHDDLKPLSMGFEDWYGEPLLMTPVDAFSTMKIMELDEQAEDTKKLILENLSFDRDIDVQLFEVNIRLLGGLPTLQCRGLWRLKLTGSKHWQKPKNTWNR